METSRTAVKLEECPFLRPGRPLSRKAMLIGVYCRLPGGDVRVPTRDEMRRFCIPQRFTACPVYQRHAAHR